MAHLTAYVLFLPLLMPTTVRILLSCRSCNEASMVVISWISWFLKSKWYISNKRKRLKIRNVAWIGKWWHNDVVSTSSRRRHRHCQRHHHFFHLFFSMRKWEEKKEMKCFLTIICICMHENMLFLSHAPLHPLQFALFYMRFQVIF